MRRTATTVINQTTSSTRFMKRALSSPFPCNIVTAADLKEVLTPPEDPADPWHPYNDTLTYITDFLCKEHPLSGHRHPVCPFTRKAIKEDSIYVCTASPTGEADERSYIEDVAMQGLKLFKDLPPHSGKLAKFKTLIMIFPNLENTAIIDEVQTTVQPLFVENGLMIGEFHSRNETPGMHNHSWRPLRTKWPMLVIRSMVKGDSFFLKQEKYGNDRDTMIRAHAKHMGPTIQRRNFNTTAAAPASADSQIPVETDSRASGKADSGTPALETDPRLPSGKCPRAASTPNSKCPTKDPEATALLEPDLQEMERLIRDVGTRVSQYIHELPQTPTLEGFEYPEVPGGKTAEDHAFHLKEEALPEAPTKFEDLMKVLFKDCLPVGINTAHPGYMGHIGGGGLYLAAVADYIASAVNRQMGVRQCCPGFVRLEMNVLRWFCNLAGLPERSSFGILTTCGTTATQSAIAAARTRRFAPGSDLSKGIIYTSEQAHMCVEKAAFVTGFPVENVRFVPCKEDGLGMCMESLARMVDQDRANDLTPFLVVPTAGTTNTGAVDDLQACADVAAEKDLWMHTDAAYGFFYTMTQAGRAAFRGIERSDSICLDPHKGLGLPYATGCLLVRDHSSLKKVHSAYESREQYKYLPKLANAETDVPDLIDFTSYSPELSRGFWGLRLWLPLKLYGAEAFRSKLEENMQNARWLADELRKIDGLTVVTEPQLSILSFSVTWREGMSLEEVNAKNRALLGAINAGGKVFLSSAEVQGRFIIRVAVNSVRTHRPQLEILLKAVRSTLE